MEEDDTGRATGGGGVPGNSDPDARRDESYNADGGRKAEHPAEFFPDSKDAMKVD